MTKCLFSQMGRNEKCYRWDKKLQMANNFLGSYWLLFLNMWLTLMRHFLWDQPHWRCYSSVVSWKVYSSCQREDLGSGDWEKEMIWGRKSLWEGIYINSGSVGLENEPGFVTYLYGRIRQRMAFSLWDHLMYWCCRSWTCSGFMKSICLSECLLEDYGATVELFALWHRAETEGT